MALVEIKNVRKNYGPLEVLKGVSLDVEKGEIVTIIGRSGSGKSTLLRCINALETINSGEILLEGQPVSANMDGLRQMRQKVGIVFQAFNLFPHMTIEKNVTLAPVLTGRTDKRGARELALSVLERVGLADKLKAYPEQLSGGQQQRVAIGPLSGNVASPDALRRSNFGTRSGTCR
jgi:polar amino acid transport system ATP-binding protein